MPGKSLGVAVATYHSHESAADAVEKLNNLAILGKTTSACWKDPNFDIIQELAFETRVLYAKNLSNQTTVPQLKELFEQHGQVLRIRKYARKAFVEFDTIEAAKAAYLALNEFRLNGLALELFPARKYDSEKERDLPDRNICFSKNFLLESDQQAFLKYAHSGVAPELDEDILAKCKRIIENTQNMQRTQVENLQNQVNQFRMLQSAPGGDNNQMMMMMMLMGGMGGAGGQNPMMNMMNPMGGMNSMGGMNPMGMNPMGMNPMMMMGNNPQVKMEGNFQQQSGQPNMQGMQQQPQQGGQPNMQGMQLPQQSGQPSMQGMQQPQQGGQPNMQSMQQQGGMPGYGGMNPMGNMGTPGGQMGGMNMMNMMNMMQQQQGMNPNNDGNYNN